MKQIHRSGTAKQIPVRCDAAGEQDDATGTDAAFDDKRPMISVERREDSWLTSLGQFFGVERPVDQRKRRSPIPPGRFNVAIFSIVFVSIARRFGAVAPSGVLIEKPLLFRKSLSNPQSAVRSVMRIARVGLNGL